MKRIGVLTSGGDCSGMNATLRAVVRAALGAGCQVTGVEKGYRGLIEGDFLPMNTLTVSNILQRGGTILHSARCLEMHETAGQRKAAANLRERGIEGLVVIGGDGSLHGGLALHRLGVRVIGIPASIDNDLPFTELALGVDTALNNIVYAVDCLKDTASSHDRTFVVETMGRNCGFLAMAASVACGAEFAIIPEFPFHLDEICRVLHRRFQEGRDNSLIMVAEGAGRAQEVADQIKDRIGFDTRIMVLGHYQRGGSPSFLDRQLASRFGVAAVEALLRGESAKMVGLLNGGVQLTDLEAVFAAGQRPLDAMILRLAGILGI